MTTEKRPRGRPRKEPIAVDTAVIDLLGRIADHQQVTIDHLAAIRAAVEKQAAAAFPDIMTVPQAAGYLQMHRVSAESLTRVGGPIAAARIGTSVRVRRAAIDAFLASEEQRQGAGGAPVELFGRRRAS